LNSSTPREVAEYQIDCFKRYKKYIDFPLEYKYLFGNSLNVLIPLETELNKVMVVGAYPSAKFNVIEGEKGIKVTDTPVEDIDSPFSNQTYFDGSRVRTVPSGQELNENILDQIGVNRAECWITNLVKVFLFKKGHVDRYKKLGVVDIQENRSKFFKYAEKSIYWLNREIDICDPYVIILLGVEVVKAIFGISDYTAKSYLDGILRKKEVNGRLRNFVCLPHPGILMKRTNRNPWPEKFEKEISVTARNEILKLKESVASKHGNDVLRLKNHQIELLGQAIQDYNFPCVYYDFNNDDEISAPNMIPVEKAIRNNLISGSIENVKNGLSNVLYWGYAQVGYRDTRIIRFRSEVSNRQLQDAASLFQQHDDLDLLEIKSIKLPQFSGMSFVSKIMMFLNPNKYVILDRQILKMNQVPISTLLNEIIFGDGENQIRISKNNNRVYLNWCNKCSEISELIFDGQYRAVDIERGFFKLIQNKEIIQAATILSNV